MIADKRVLVTGGIGFLGKHPCDEVAKYVPEFILVLRKKSHDLTDQTDCRKLFEEYKPEVVIRKVLEAPDSVKRFVEAWGTGIASREFLFVRDAAKGIAHAAEQYDGAEPSNLGRGMEITIKDLTEVICELCGYSGEVRWDHTKPDGQPRRLLDSSKARAAFGFQSTTGFVEDLRETIRWYVLLNIEGEEQFPLRTREGEFAGAVVIGEVSRCQQAKCGLASTRTAPMVPPRLGDSMTGCKTSYSRRAKELGPITLDGQSPVLVGDGHVNPTRRIGLTEIHQLRRLVHHGDVRDWGREGDYQMAGGLNDAEDFPNFAQRPARPITAAEGFEPGDCLIIARDITLCNFGGGIESVGLQKVVWVRLKYRRWLEKPPAQHTLSMWGNHDFLGELPESVPNYMPWRLLRDEATELMGMKFYGSPCTNTLGSWAF